MDSREHLLTAALTVFGESGTRGATTRRIAEVAGVNEVTLFRQFGSKEALLREALVWRAAEVAASRLPVEPVDPEAELIQFALEHHQALWESRSVIRKCMAEFEEHPSMSQAAREKTAEVDNELHDYLVRLQASGRTSHDWQPKTATAMLMGTLFADAMGRDCMPECCPGTPREAIEQYVRLFLTAIGVQVAVGVRRAPGASAQ
jgi:AcrR family transcriptional regulator